MLSRNLFLSFSVLQARELNKFVHENANPVLSQSVFVFLCFASSNYDVRTSYVDVKLGSQSVFVFLCFARIKMKVLETTNPNVLSRNLFLSFSVLQG